MKFVRTKDVLRMLGVSRTTLWRMVQAGEFPRPVVIAWRATGHVLEDVEAWMAARSQANATDPPQVSGFRGHLAGGKGSGVGDPLGGPIAHPADPPRRRRRGRG